MRALVLTNAGAQVQRGDLDDLESLRNGAATSDGVIHCAFNHDFSKLAANCETDRRAIEVLGDTLAGSDRPLVVTSGTALVAPGRVATEDDIPAPSPFPRVSEETAVSLAGRGVHASVIRLPQVHDRDKHGLVTWMIALAREKGVSAYVGDGRNRWPAVHRLDVAPLYRLALENGVAGARYHAVAEEGVPLQEITRKPSPCEGAGCFDVGEEAAGHWFPRVLRRRRRSGFGALTQNGWAGAWQNGPG